MQLAIIELVKITNHERHKTVNTTTRAPKANAKLANELKKLGFSRGIASWEKSDFSKRIWSQKHDFVGYLFWFSTMSSYSTNSSW